MKNQEKSKCTSSILINDERGIGIELRKVSKKIEDEKGSNEELAMRREDLYGGGSL